MDGSEGQAGTTTPQGAVAIDVGRVVATLSRLQVSKSSLGSAVVEETPKKSRNKPRRLPRRTLFSRAEELHTGARSDRLVSPPVQPRQSWTVNEERALVNFLLLYTEATSWSSRAGKGTTVFWESAGAYVQSEVHSAYCRSGIDFCTIVPTVGLCTDAGLYNTH